MVALRARELGADVSTAALVAALLGIGMLSTSLPAGALVERIGERRTLVAAGFTQAVLMVVGAGLDSVPALAIAVFAYGGADTAFHIARQSFVIDAVPLSHRARAMATLGGSFRVGIVLGPLVGAAVIHLVDLSAVFVVAAICSFGAGLLAVSVRDLEHSPDGAPVRRDPVRVHSVLWQSRKTLLTLGSAAFVIGVARSTRDGLVPLWANHIEVPASHVSLIFALVGLIELALFYPSGLIIDRWGRRFSAVPVVLGIGLACLALPLASNTAGFAAVLVVFAASNGVGAGILMTMGADTAPGVGRAHYLGAWRLCADSGKGAGPLSVAALATVVPLGVTCFIVGAVMVLGTAWVTHWVRRLDADLIKTRRA